MNHISPKAEVSDSALIKSSYIEGPVKIGKQCKIVEAKLLGKITVGDYTSITGPNVDFYSKKNSIVIGRFCSIARNVSVQEFNHNWKKITTYNIGKNLFNEKWDNESVSAGNIEIGNDVWIGTQCVILSGVKIGDGAIIGANSTVTADIPPYAIALGSPARVVKYRFPSEKIEELLQMQWWDWPVEKIIQHKEMFIKEL